MPVAKALLGPGPRWPPIPHLLGTPSLQTSLETRSGSGQPKASVFRLYLPLGACLLSAWRRPALCKRHCGASPLRQSLGHGTCVDRSRNGRLRHSWHPGSVHVYVQVCGLWGGDQVGPLWPKHIPSGEGREELQKCLLCQHRRAVSSPRNEFVELGQCRRPGVSRSSEPGRCPRHPSQHALLCQPSPI